MFAGVTSIFASARRVRSPPESTATFLSESSPEKRKRPQQVTRLDLDLGGIARASSSMTRFLGSSASIWC